MSRVTVIYWSLIFSLKKKDKKNDKKSVWTSSDGQIELSRQYMSIPFLFLRGLVGAVAWFSLAFSFFKSSHQHVLSIPVLVVSYVV